MTRATVVVALPDGERQQVRAALAAGEYECVPVTDRRSLERALTSQPDVSLVILDLEHDLDAGLEHYSVVRELAPGSAALLVVTPATMQMLPGSSLQRNDEYAVRPFTAEALRWQVEAMLIRARIVDPAMSGRSGPEDEDDVEAGRRAPILSVFSPKGGVGKTMIAANLAAALQLRRGLRVLLVDADTISGHVSISLGLTHTRTVADAWRDEAEGADPASIDEIAAAHPSGLRVVSLASDPLHAEFLSPDRVADALGAWRRSFDIVVVDLHPDYETMNRVILGSSDRILVPVTPDIPSIRAAVQLREVANVLGFAERLDLVVNRAGSGVSVADMERTLGIRSIAEIRSAGLLCVRAANEGRTVIERYPRERVSEDLVALAAQVAPEALPSPMPAEAAPARFSILGRSRSAPVRTR
jgi:pilus assembly protein CpaE